jgi:hypothetical protein
MNKETFMVKSSNGRLYVAAYDEKTHSTLFGQRDSISLSEPPPKEFSDKLEALNVANSLNATSNEKYLVTNFVG